MLKKPLLAIKMSPEFHSDCETGVKNLTVREGARAYTLGPAMLVCSLKQWCLDVNIVEVNQLFLRELDLETIQRNGYESLTKLIEYLRKWYPDINKDSIVTVIKWELSKAYD